MMATPVYKTLIEDLGYENLPERTEHVYHDWVKSARIWYMSKDDLLWIIKILELDEHTQDVLLFTYETIVIEERLSLLLSFLQYVIIIGAHPSDWLIKEAPQIRHHNIKPSVFQLMTILSLIPVAKEDHERRNIPEEHMMFNLNHLKGYIKNYHQKNNEVGIENFGWTTYLASLGLIHLSSLHFMHHVYTDRFIFLKNHTTHEVIALAQKDISVRKDGQFNGVNGYIDQQFVTTYDEDASSYSGYRVNPMGSITSEYQEFDKNQYDIVLKPGDYVIDFHIPTGSDYTIEGFKYSLQLAKDFFQSHYADYSYAAFWCVSWLYSPQINMLIRKPNSHIVQIAQQGYRLPATPDARSIYSFVFGTSEPDFTRIVPKTTLQNQIIQHVTSGYTINAGCFIYFMDDLNHFGNLHYVNHVDIETHDVRIQKKRG